MIRQQPLPGWYHIDSEPVIVDRIFLTVGNEKALSAGNKFSEPCECTYLSIHSFAPLSCTQDNYSIFLSCTQDNYSIFLSCLQDGMRLCVILTAFMVPETEPVWLSEIRMELQQPGSMRFSVSPCS